MSFDFNASDYYSNLNNFNLYKKGKKDGTNDASGDGKINTNDWRQGLDGEKGYSLKDLVIISSAVKNFDSLSEDEKKNLDMNGDGKVDAKDKKLLEEQKELIRQMVAQQKTNDISDIDGDGKIDSKDWDAFKKLKDELTKAEGGELSKKMQSTLDNVEKRLSNKLFDQNSSSTLNAKDLARMDINALLAQYFATDDYSKLIDLPYRYDYVGKVLGVDINGDGNADIEDAKISFKYLDIDGDGEITEKDAKEWGMRAEQFKLYLDIDRNSVEYKNEYKEGYLAHVRSTQNKVLSQRINSLIQQRTKAKAELNYLQVHANNARAKGKKISSEFEAKIVACQTKIQNLSDDISWLRAHMEP